MDPLGGCRREAGGGVPEHLAVPDAERLDPPLLPQGERDEEAELDELGHGEEPVEPRPQRVIGDLGVPDDRTRVGEGRLLALAECARVGEVQELVVLRFRRSLPSSLDGPLNPSVLALDGFRDVHPAQLLDAVVEDAVTKG